MQLCRLPGRIISTVESAPELSGVYIFKSGGRPIYIGKAKNLKHRLKNYINPDSERIRKMVAEADDIEIIITESERNAIFLEANLIRKHKPKYNIRLKGAPPFYYIHITNETYPRIVLSREPLEGGENFGPYINRMQVRYFVKFARKMFPIRNCSLNLPSKRKVKPCIEYHIKRCTAPCMYDQVESYNELVKGFKNFLMGNVNEVANYIYQKMNEEASNLNFEAAALWRDRLRSLNEFMVRRARSSVDIWAIYTLGSTSCIVVYTVKDGIVSKTAKFLTTTSIYGEVGTLEEFLIMFYTGNMVDIDEIVVPFDMDMDEINGIRIRKVNGKEREMLEAAAMCARFEVESYILKSSRHHPALESLKKLLNLDKVPLRIEGFDISHTFGDNKVGSLVVFRDGRPLKSEYRRFKIKTVKGIDDFASMYEVVLRRYKRVLEEGKELPNLILIDGGIGQLNAALKALKELDLNIPAVALAKRFETVILPGNRVVQIPTTDPALKLLQNIRDEAHRFALKYHTSLRSKTARKTILDIIPGIGEKRKKVLLAHFGSISRIKSASIDEIASLPGFNRKVAKVLKDYLNA